MREEHLQAGSNKPASYYMGTAQMHKEEEHKPINPPKGIKRSKKLNLQNTVNHYELPKSALWVSVGLAGLILSLIAVGYRICQYYS